MGKLDTFGKVVRHWREYSGMSLRSLADEAEISPTYLSLIERDQVAPPSEQVILDIEFALNLRPGELLEVSGRVPKDVIKVLSRRPVMCELVRAYAEYFSDEQVEELLDGLQ